MNVFDLFAKLSLDDSDFSSKLSGAAKSAKKFGGKLGSAIKTGSKVAVGAIAAVGTATAAMGAAIVKSTGQIAAQGDEVDKMSQKLGLSAKAYQEWDYVLGQAGVEITSMSTGLKTLTNKIDDAKNGGSAAQEMFAKLGISMEDLNNMFNKKEK